MKLVKLQNLVAKCCKVWKIQPCKVCKFCICLYYVWKLLPFSAQKWPAISAHNTKYANFARLYFHILQYFVPKFCNFTNFNKFFTGIYFFLPRSDIQVVYITTGFSGFLCSQVPLIKWVYAQLRAFIEIFSVIINT